MKKLTEAYAWFEDMISGTFLTIGIAMIFYGVITRYVFNSPSNWVDEISKYFIIWGALMGTAVAMRDHHHIRVDMLFNALPKGLQKPVKFFSNFVVLLFCLFLVFYGTELVLFKLKTGQNSMDVGVPMWIVYLIMPICGVMFGIRTLEQLYYIFKPEKEEDVEVDLSTF